MCGGSSPLDLEHTAHLSPAIKRMTHNMHACFCGVVQGSLCGAQGGGAQNSSCLVLGLCVDLVCGLPFAVTLWFRLLVRVCMWGPALNLVPTPAHTCTKRHLCVRVGASPPGCTHLYLLACLCLWGRVTGASPPDLLHKQICTSPPCTTAAPVCSTLTVMAYARACAEPVQQALRWQHGCTVAPPIITCVAASSHGSLCALLGPCPIATPCCVEVGGVKVSVELRDGNAQGENQRASCVD